MFIELEPLLADRTFVLTISGIGNNVLRVNVIPKAVKENDAAEKALTAPLSFTGTAAELDLEFPTQLASFTNTILQTGCTLQQVQETHKAAIREIEAENKKALDNKRKGSGGKAPAPVEQKSAPATKEAKPVLETKPATSSVASLFDDPVEPADQADNSTANTKDSPSCTDSE